MSLVTTAKLTCGHRAWLSTCTSAVFPLPTGPATPIRNAPVIDQSSLEQEITLRQRQHASRLAGEQLTIGANLICFRIHFDLRRSRVVNHIRLADLSAILNGDQALAKAQPLYMRNR